MTTLAKVRMPFLISTMSTHQWEELNVVKRNTCNYSCPTWRSTSRTMAAKVSRIASWVLVHSLSWAQRKRWIPIGSMGCVHTHQRILTIEGWGSLSHIQKVVEKIGEDNWKARKTSRVVSLTLALGPKHDKIWTRGPLNRLVRRWWMWIWSRQHQKLLGGRLVYELEVLLSYQRILELNGVQILKGGKS
jgi:hypothetical protein